MSNITVHFYTTGNGKSRASIVDNGKVMYMSAGQARAYLNGKVYTKGHETNPTRPFANS